jgi:D-tyrosyl-tRNA(Tyr) deacylase
VKVLLQRVSRASVRVEQRLVGEIGPGLLVLVGIERGDTSEDAVYFADKTADLRIFADENGKMNRSVGQVGGEVLVVSQFTLGASTRKGRRPSYSKAAEPGVARSLYEVYMERLRDRRVPVAAGAFREHMHVELINDGPVTILLDPPTAGELP